MQATGFKTLAESRCIRRDTAEDFDVLFDEKLVANRPCYSRASGHLHQSIMGQATE